MLQELLTPRVERSNNATPVVNPSIESTKTYTYQPIGEVQDFEASMRLQHHARLNLDDPNHLHRTSIVCTIGPACQSEEMLLKLRRAGMAIARMNCSHGSHEYHLKTINNLRATYQHMRGHVAIALDTKGPEIRTGNMVDGKEITVKAGDQLTVTTDPKFKDLCDAQRLYIDYPKLCMILTPGSRIYVNDGLLCLKVVDKVSDTELLAQAMNTSAITSRRGVNLPGVDVDLPAASEKDISDLRFAVENEIDMVFASFIRKATDVKEIRKILGDDGKKVKLIAKIENAEGIRNFDSILHEADGIMVARGDLGIEIPPEKVFIAQKMMIAKCNILGKPCICATQMLESMTVNPRPTRAEASDVANAVLDGADVVMLSGETAKGLFPAESVEMMRKICREAERTFFRGPLFFELKALTPKPTTPTETLCSSSVNAANDNYCAAILVLTASGETCRLVAKYRPNCPIIVVSADPKTCRTVHLYRGCFPFHYKEKRASMLDGFSHADEMNKRIEFGIEKAMEAGYLKEGDTVLTLQGWCLVKGKTNTMRLLRITSSDD